MSDIRWTDKIWLDSDGNLQSFEGPICVSGADMREGAKMEIADTRSITEKFTKIKAIIDNWAVDDDEHELLEQIADIIEEEEDEG